MSVVIKAENISKIYRLGIIGAQTLSEDVNRLFYRLIGKEDPYLKTVAENDREKAANGHFVWALKNVSFEVKNGEVIGIIGRNGAGKSTLLKILSRVTAPTSGCVKIKGRVASLLEVGTGFHPELTGKENIFLNGAILGMTKSEITSKLDEIIEFSGVARYIDTPVKRYSSGMYVRLAFAVAAHLDPEILIVDEVLAVGDSAFQKKCLGKMKDVSGSGRTILFVSHNMNAVRSLCSRAMLLKNGQIISEGATEQVLRDYDATLRDIGFSADMSVGNELNRRGSGLVRFSSIKVTNLHDVETDVFEYGESIVFHFKIISQVNLKDVVVLIALKSGVYREFVTSTPYHKLPFDEIKPGQEYAFKIIIPDPLIRPGEYPLYFFLSDSNIQPYDIVDDIIPPLIIQSKKTIDELGFDPTIHSGYFSVKSQIHTD
jgi:lipopolysaccharide transport system ATP-binding protein